MNTIVTAGIVAAIVALVGHVLTRLNTKTQAQISRETAQLSARLSANVKLAEMRQAWLNSLREEMTTMVALAVAGELQNGPTEAYSRAGTKIELLMNSADPDYLDLKEAMARFLGVESGEELSSRNDQFVTVSQRILKREWEVLKNEIKSVVDFGGVLTNNSKASP
jgi:hypothetical protein